MNIERWNALTLLVAGTVLGALLGATLTAPFSGAPQILTLLQTWQPLTAAVIATAVATATITITLRQNAAIRAVSAHKMTADATDNFVSELSTLAKIEDKIDEIYNLSDKTPDFDWTDEQHSKWFEDTKYSVTALMETMKELKHHENRNPIGSPTNASRTVCIIGISGAMDAIIKLRIDAAAYLDGEIDIDESKKRDDLARMAVRNCKITFDSHRIFIKKRVRDGRVKMRGYEDLIIR
ncbi:hypothetical protein V5F40_06765 [Xanthobacter sp. DSM 14520]|uniref:hypothetical protein n=1 Tax=Xanthobacter autotrophicus (strain ATCC BAA-1158 / Py2) TaxID=78245 RepID=UPI003728C9F1